MSDDPRVRRRTARSMGEKLLDRFSRPPKDQGAWAFFTEAMVRSPALTTLSVNAFRVLLRLIAEHLTHGRKHNGKLEVSHGQFREAGACNDLVADAIEELSYKGLVRVERGRAATGTPHPNRYRLTWTGDWQGAPPTNDWKGTTLARCQQWDALRKERQSKRAVDAARRKISRSEKSESRRSEKSESGPLSTETGRRAKA